MSDQYDVKGATRVFWREIFLYGLGVFLLGATIGAVILVVRG